MAEYKKSESVANHKENNFHPQSANPSRFYIGTYFATADETAVYLRDGTVPELRMEYMHEKIECWRGQWEFGGRNDKNGKLHVQFAVAFEDKIRYPQARNYLGYGGKPFTGWLEVARSDAIWDYVSKDDTRVSPCDPYGNLKVPQNGHRTDLDVIHETIAAGASVYEIMDKFPRQFMRNHAAISKLCTLYDKPRVYGPCHVEIWWGVTGSGKSHKAFHDYPDAYRKTIPGKWWDGYRGQEVVVFEEFNPDEDKELRLPELLKILDKYPYTVEVKGTSCQLKANKFIITTNIDPRLWYQGHPQQPALARRISKVLRFIRPWKEGEDVMDGVVEYPGMRPLSSGPVALD